MIDFAKWVAWVFDHPVGESPWYWQADHEHYELPSAVTVDYLSRLFRHATRYLHPYSDAQVNEGFWFLVYNAYSNHFMAFLDEEVPLESRIHGIQSIFELYRDFFATRCTNHLSHLDEKGANFNDKEAAPLNLVCYMWWELSPLLGEEDKATSLPIDEAALHVLEQTLYLNNEACIESALHGLGHFSLNHQGCSASIIEKFLQTKTNLRQPLVDYARSAQVGALL